MIYATLPLAIFGALTTLALTGVMSNQVSDRVQVKLQAISRASQEPL